jgi:hypothetical protein
MKIESILRSISRREPLSFEEIGFLLGMSRQNVFNVYLRALAKMRKRMKAMDAEVE